MTDLKQAAQQALEALESGLAFDTHSDVLQNLRTALEQPEQQADPVAVYQWRKQGCADWYDGHPDYSDCGGPYETRTLRIAAMQVHPLEFCQMVEGKETVTGIPMYWAEWPSKEVV